jgi:hypothetical protein
MTYKSPETELKHFDDYDDRSTLSISNTPDISEPSTTPQLKVEQNLNTNMKLYTKFKKICILHKIKQINQDMRLRDDYMKKYYMKKYYGNIICDLIIDKPVDKPTKLEIMEIKLTLIGLYCLGLTATLIFYK